MGSHAEPAGFHAHFVRLRFREVEQLATAIKLPLTGASWGVIHAVTDDADNVHAAPFTALTAWPLPWAASRRKRGAQRDSSTSCDAASSLTQDVAFKN